MCALDVFSAHDGISSNSHNKINFEETKVSAVSKNYTAGPVLPLVCLFKDGDVFWSIVSCKLWDAFFVIRFLDGLQWVLTFESWPDGKDQNLK